MFLNGEMVESRLLHQDTFHFSEGKRTTVFYSHTQTGRLDEFLSAISFVGRYPVLVFGNHCTVGTAVGWKLSVAAHLERILDFEIGTRNAVRSGCLTHS